MVPSGLGGRMDEKLQRKRAGKRLLVAAIGVATVSYVSTQSGCAADGATDEEAQTASDQPYDDEEADIQSSAQALTTSAANVALPIPVTPIKVKFPPVGNLMPPVGNLVRPPPVGNLVRPPPVGNLMAPPVLETLATQATK